MAYCEQCAALQRQNDLLASDRDGYVQLLTDENNKLRAEVKRLKAVEADYDLHEREMLDLEEDNGRLTAENEKLKRMAIAQEKLLRSKDAENERLRAALKTILDLTDYGTETATWRMTNTIHNANVIARAALTQEKRDE